MNQRESIHSNPDAQAWAKFFIKTQAETGFMIDEALMIGWFANAMMAMHDHLKGGGPINGDHAQYLIDQQEPCGYVYSVATNPGEKSAALSADIPNGTPLYTTPPNTLAVLNQALEALCLPCARWNKTQTKIVNAAIAAIREQLGETK